MATGGSIQDVSIRARLFAVAADTGPKLDLGGFENELEMNGDSTVRTIKKRKQWRKEGLKLTIDHDRADLEFLQEVADDKKHVAITMTCVDGTTYAATGTIVGEIAEDTMSATCEVTLAGGGKAEAQ